MQIRKESRAPMRTGRQRNFQRTKPHGLPVIKLMHDVETKIMHEVSDADRDDDRLISGNATQGAPVEMIEMRMRHQNEIDRGQMMNFKSRLLEPLDYLQPKRPVGIDQDIDFVGLNQKRGVPDPGYTNFALANFGEMGLRVIAGTLRKKRRNQDAGKEIALVPVGPRAQTNARGALIFCAVL